MNYSEDNAESHLFVEVGGGVTFMYQSVKNITRENSEMYLKVNGVNSKPTTGNVIRDIDGSLSVLGKVTLRLDYALEGDTTLLVLKNVKSTAKVTKAGWQEVGNLAALRSHSGRAWFKSGNTIHVKLKASGNSKAFGARDSVDVEF